MAAFQTKHVVTCETYMKCVTTKKSLSDYQKVWVPLPDSCPTKWSLHVCVLCFSGNKKLLFGYRYNFLNKRPKGPHKVHLSTMCYLFDGSARVTIFVYWSAKKRKLGRGCWDLASCQLSLKSNNLSQWETKTAILFFRSAWKTQTS